MSQLATSMGAIAVSNKDPSGFRASSINEPTQTGLSIGYQFASESEFRDENISIYSGQPFDSRSMSRVEDTQQRPVARLSPYQNGGVYTRKISATEYLQTMLTTDASPELVPAFQSWTLLCLGSASVYNPQKGIEQQGFFSGSNYLLPWEIRLSDNAMLIMQKEIGNEVKDNGEEQWPAPAEASKSTGTVPTGPGAHVPIFQTTSKLRSLSKDLDNKDIQGAPAKCLTPTKQQKGGKEEKSKPPGIKAYIGNEYECPRGHR